MPLMTRQSIGAPMTWNILGDKHPVRVASAPQIDSSAGAARQVVEVVVYRATRDGGDDSKYLSSRIVSTAFLTRRTDRVEALDGTKNKPKPISALIDEAAEAFAAYQSTRAEASDIATLEAELAD
ncbi:MAG: hypothetical protein DRR06_15840 [Gammaproteobacteria bacterium]|nr:MAG: hypothetical protein DRR06_15840 [Gammaproteobacteria bacterium]